MPSNQTPNYQLSQWERDDKIQMEDFNADNIKIDAALKAQASTCASLQALMNKKGNCSVGSFTYTGNGKYGRDNPTRITFPQKPILYVVLGRNLMIGGSIQAVHTYPISGAYVVSKIETTWSGNTVSFWDSSSSDKQMNENTTVYQVIAFYAS